MEIINNPTHDEIKKAAKALKDGYLVAFPTETVYGLGADAISADAVSRIYSVKGRPTDHPLIVHISSISQLDKWAIEIPEYAIKLASEFWPGPMTLILKRSNLAKDFITGGQSSVGLRVPAQPVALALLNEFEKIGGNGIAAPSANRFKGVSPTTAIDVTVELEEYCSKKDLILDGGNCSIGLESTIIDCSKSKPEIVRLGGLIKSKINTSLGLVVSDKSQIEGNKVPGSHKKHYSPRALLRINLIPKPNDGFIASKNYPTPAGVIRLASPETLEEFGQTLYSALRLGDKLGLKVIVVNPPEESGLGEVIRDRLNRASFEFDKKLI